MDEDLLATCAGLGYTDNDKYFRGEECWGKLIDDSADFCIGEELFF